MKYPIHLRRIYQPIEPAFRVLTDRLWSRGKKAEELALDLWLPEIAPSHNLRRSFHRGEMDFLAFSNAYSNELKTLEALFLPLMCAARQGRVDLLTAAQRPEMSHLPTIQRQLLVLLERDDQLAEGNEPSSPPCYLAQFSKDF
ncbi:DUF488 domain-containing protein [Marinospirillum alkaliphilum]|uniref:Uncharacterized conserved protein YeaO, DUF488 family n=1 Tax=Marinospirillum alkaliphilum DSM 21637 TaxID=1122209 RepID=A0A1K1WRG2_9GAMM|nr:DUF488 family protein [Marinospirillum alkaliphilum]SFX39950.1 Uncharacterized conserved protein YeaO, DUF488 family [Marinospirillum alkaliphilum DSM 21637]